MKRNSVTGFVLLVGSIMTIGLPGKALAKSNVDGAPARTANFTGVTHTANCAKPVLASLRYYGGPKSPMWR